MSFPHINVERYKDTDDILEVYIFENEEDPECPIIMHFVLINKDFKKYIKPGEETSQISFALPRVRMILILRFLKYKVDVY